VLLLVDEAIGRIPWLTVEMFYREVHGEIFFKKSASIALMFALLPIKYEKLKA
jgi:hypothetical protein